MKKIFIPLATLGIAVFAAFSVNAATVNMPSDYSVVTESDITDNNALGYTTEMLQVTGMDSNVRARANRNLSNLALNNFSRITEQANNVLISEDRFTGSYRQQAILQTDNFLSVRISRSLYENDYQLYTETKGAVINAKTGDTVALDEIFLDSASYKQVIANLSENPGEEYRFCDLDNCFYLTDSDLVLIYTRGEEESKQLRSLEVRIPLTQIGEYLKPDYR